MDRNNVAPLFAPWTRDARGTLRPSVSEEAMQLSASLAGATYRMDVEPWLRAGWRDAVMLVDGALIAAPRDESWLTAQLRRHRAQARLGQRGSWSHLLETIRRDDRPDTCKALVMVHPGPQGRWVVAVSFMGTGTRLEDWIANFRVTSVDGVHKGFLQLARQFEANEERIVFPETARALGVPRLTLRDALDEMRYPNSRFLLWLSGHSQGAAVMQVYAHHKLREDGLLPRHLVGYGFASPTVMTGTAVPDPAAYPLYHVQNSDDLVPRCGAQVHLGVCLTYPADEELRRCCYPWRMDEMHRHARALTAPLLHRMTNTAGCVESAVAFLNVVARLDMSETLAVLGLDKAPFRRVAAAADWTELTRIARHRAALAYRSMTGQPLNLARVADAMADIRAVIRVIGLKAMMDALRELTYAPHSIAARLPEDCVGAYRFIARYGAEKLLPSVWLAGAPPRQVMLVARTARKHLDTASGEGLFNRRPVRSPRRFRPNPRRRDPRPRTDTRHHLPVLEQV